MCVCERERVVSEDERGKLKRNDTERVERVYGGGGECETWWCVGGGICGHGWAERREEKGLT